MIARKANTVLVVDDNPVVLQTTAAMLKRAGYTTITADSGATALALLDQPLSALVTDLQMPGISGIELTHRARTRHPHLRVIVLTGNPTTDATTAAEQAGATALLAKPFTTEDTPRDARRLRYVAASVAADAGVGVRACGWCSEVVVAGSYGDRVVVFP